MLTRNQHLDEELAQTKPSQDLSEVGWLGKIVQNTRWVAVLLLRYLPPIQSEVMP